MMSEIIEAIIKFIVKFIFEIFLTYTGEIVLFVITFGKRKPRWDLYAKETAGRFVIFTEISFWVGSAVWLIAILIIYWLFVRS